MVSVAFPTIAVSLAAKTGGVWALTVDRKNQKKKNKI